MSEIKRYNIDWRMECIEESPDGQFVLFEDVKELIKNSIESTPEAFFKRLKKNGWIVQSVGIRGSSGRD